jgi:hypothetical protein
MEKLGDPKVSTREPFFYFLVASLSRERRLAMVAAMVHPNNFPVEDPHASLEKMYIQDYLRSKGHTLASLRQLPKMIARRYRIEASIYASIHLAEAEMRANFLQRLRGKN